MTAISPNVVVTILLKLKEERLGECAVLLHTFSRLLSAPLLECKSLNSHFVSTLLSICFATLRLACASLGLGKGIHTVIIAMTSCNDVIAIFLFGVLCGIVFSTGNLTHQLLQGPVGIVLGCVFGAVSGFFVLLLPSDSAVKYFLSLKVDPCLSDFVATLFLQILN